MKLHLYATLLIAILFLIGCATSSYTVGRDFPSDNVSQIVKGKTTDLAMVKMFGEPFTKTVISATDEKWIYMYSNGTAKAQSYVVTMKVKTTGIQKTLDVLIINGVVANFAYTEGQNPYGMKVN